MNKLPILYLFCAFLPAGLALKCHQCKGLPYDCSVSTQLCTINQTSCMSQTFTVVANGTLSDWTYKGCSQGLRCNESVYVDMGFQKKTYISSTCCETDMCNIGTYYTRPPVASLQCQNCVGNSSTCASSNTTILCAGYQDRCMIVTTVYSNVSSSDVVIKGCGTGNLCGRRLHYNSGGVKVYSEITCCGYDNCNKGVNTVTLNKTLNGQQCYACNETGKGECTTPTNTVSCTGNMTACVDVVGFPRGNTLLRGCVSSDVCYGLSASMSLQASQKLYCCSGKLCNSGNIASYFQSGSTMERGRVHIITITFMGLVGLLRTLL